MDAQITRFLEACLQVDDKGPEAELLAFAESAGVKHLNQFAWHLDAVKSELPVGTIVHLIRLFTRLETLQLSPGFCGGSTTRVPMLLSELAGHDPEWAQELTVWAFHTTTNPYVPFGTSNAIRQSAKSLAAYWRLQNRRVVKVATEEAARSDAARERAAARAQTHAGERENHARRNAERDALLARLAQVDARARLEQIALATDYPIAAFPDTWALAKAAMGLSPDIRQALLRRLEHAPKGPWGELAKVLRQSSAVSPPG